MFLKELEEVLNFETAILGHVCAVKGVAHSVEAELSSTVKQNYVKGIVDNRIVVGYKFCLGSRRYTYLMVLGRKCLAISGSWGPQSSRKAETALD